MLSFKAIDTTYFIWLDYWGQNINRGQWKSVKHLAIIGGCTFTFRKFIMYSKINMEIKTAAI